MSKFVRNCTPAVANHNISVVSVVLQLQIAYQDKEDENQRLKHYIDTILLNIVENYPQLLEVKSCNNRKWSLWLGWMCFFFFLILFFRRFCFWPIGDAMEQPANQQPSIYYDYLLFSGGMQKYRVGSFFVYLNLFSIASSSSSMCLLQTFSFYFEIPFSLHFVSSFFFLQMSRTVFISTYYLYTFFPLLFVCLCIQTVGIMIAWLTHIYIYNECILMCANIRSGSHWNRVVIEQASNINKASATPCW